MSEVGIAFADMLRCEILTLEWPKPRDFVDLADCDHSRGTKKVTRFCIFRGNSDCWPDQARSRFGNMWPRHKPLSQTPFSAEVDGWLNLRTWRVDQPMTAPLACNVWYGCCRAAECGCNLRLTCSPSAQTRQPPHESCHSP